MINSREHSASPKSSVHHVVKKNLKLFPYKIQKLTITDQVHRLRIVAGPLIKSTHFAMFV